MKRVKGIKNFAKLYVCTSKGIRNNLFVLSVLFKNNLWVHSFRKLTDQNWVFEVEYNSLEDLNKSLGEHTVRGNKITIYRIFKSMQIYREDKEPQKTFLDNILILLSARIIKPISIKVVNNNASDWQKELLTRWQSELDHPDKFKELGIKPLLDISPKGELLFHINKVGKYIITYFAQSIEGIYEKIN